MNIDEIRELITKCQEQIVSATKDNPVIAQELWESRDMIDCDIEIANIMYKIEGNYVFSIRFRMVMDQERYLPQRIMCEALLEDPKSKISHPTENWVRLAEKHQDYLIPASDPIFAYMQEWYTAEKIIAELERLIKRPGARCSGVGLNKLFL